MRKLLTVIFNLLFPPRPTEKILQEFDLSKINKLYRPNSIGSVNYLCAYQDTVVKACVVENKFHHNDHAAKQLGMLLQLWAKDDSAHTLYIPIPLGKERLRSRGHNQTESIIEKLTPRLNIRTDILFRTIETVPQTQLNRTERLKNIQHAFECRQAEVDWSKYNQVVIIDDVVTTGATLRAAHTTLAPTLPTHIKIRLLAIAH